jgi:hypothetical protein
MSFTSIPRTDVFVDRQERAGPLEWWRHALSHGGINTLPLPARVVEGAAKLRPRLIRIFLQEHFNIYPERGRFHWSLLDPFMEALAETRAKVVACICIKPKVLYPKVDHAIWRPTDWAEWQRVIFEMVKRYSVDKPIVTYWEVGNETDIGENGGCPYLIPDPKDYFEYYTQTIKPVLEAFPSAKVGGPASCWVDNEPLPGLVKLCRESKTQLDFISWHIYNDDPRRHALGVEKGKKLLEGWPATGRPEMLVTEWSKSFDPVSFEDLAFEPRRAACTAASILAMTEAGLDWSFYYHLWDQTFYSEPFRPFFSEAGIHMMENHWNKVPHRFGMFGVGEEARPQYFVYQMLSRMGEERVAATSEEADLRVVAARGDKRTAALLVNFNLQESRQMLVTTHFSRLNAGRKLLTVYRIDSARRWSEEKLELVPLERREVYTSDEFHCQVLLPADSVALVCLDEMVG